MFAFVFQVALFTARTLIATSGFWLGANPTNQVKNCSVRSFVRVPVFPAIATPGMYGCPAPSWNALYEVPSLTVDSIIFVTASAVSALIARATIWRAPAR